MSVPKSSVAGKNLMPETVASSGLISAMESSLSVTHFLKKVYSSETKETDPTHHQLLIIAVHSVFLESGFIPFNPTTKINGIRLPEGWASSSATSAVTISYTIPNLVNSDFNSSIETVVLRFEITRNTVFVYGYLISNGSDVLLLPLNTARFGPPIESVLKDIKPTGERAVLEFWNMIKDKLSLPLLTRVCEKTGLPAPAGFMTLAMDLKLWILEFLPARDIARAACTCLEVRYVASDDDLWRNRFGKEFGDFNAEAGLLWKEAFALRWTQERAMRQKRAMRKGLKAQKRAMRANRRRRSSAASHLCGSVCDVMKSLIRPLVDEI